MNIVVTGGSGFIGSHVVTALAGAGHQVTVFDLARPHIDVGYILSDVMSFPSLLAGTRGVDAVIHIAACSDVNVVLESPLGAVGVNVVGTANVLEAARYNGVGRVVLASTDWVCWNVRHLYTTTKVAGELLCIDYRQFYGVPFTVLRYGTVYGPGMRGSLAIPSFVRQALAGGPITVHGDGSQYRKYVHVTDLAQAHVLVLGDAGENCVYNVVGDEAVTTLRLAEMVRDAVAPGVEIVHDDARPGDSPGVDVTNEATKIRLGWAPAISFEDGLRETIEWIIASSAGSSA